MPDTKKVIEGLKKAAEELARYAPMKVNGRCQMYFDGAIHLLKEQEPKHGRWERLTGMAPPEYHGHRICSVCECFAPYDPLHMGREILSKYCPGCGAKMEGEVECD